MTELAVALMVIAIVLTIANSLLWSDWKFDKEELKILKSMVTTLNLIIANLIKQIEAKDQYVTALERHNESLITALESSKEVIRLQDEILETYRQNME